MSSSFWPTAAPWEWRWIDFEFFYGIALNLRSSIAGFPPKKKKKEKSNARRCIRHRGVSFRLHGYRVGAASQTTTITTRRWGTTTGIPFRYNPYWIWPSKRPHHNDRRRRRRRRLILVNNWKNIHNYNHNSDNNYHHCKSNASKLVFCYSRK